MKVKNKFTKSLRRILCMSLALVAVLSLLHPITAEAKTKNITLKYQPKTYSKSVADKKASVVKAGNTYKITINKHKKNNDYYGYVKFVATKNKTYTFTFSNVQLNTKKAWNAYIHPEMQDSMNKKEINVAYFKVKGYEEGTIKLSSKKKDLYPTSVTGKIALKKGEVLYLRYNFGYSSAKDKKITSKLVIK
jgi:hypothetical protein